MSYPNPTRSELYSACNGDPVRNQDDLMRAYIGSEVGNDYALDDLHELWESQPFIDAREAGDHAEVGRMLCEFELDVYRRQLLEQAEEAVYGVELDPPEWDQEDAA